MSRQINCKTNRANSWFKKIGLPFGIAFFVSIPSVQAFSLSNSSSQLLSQTPPDVIVNPGGGGGSTGGSTAPNPISSNQRFSCESYNGQYTVMYRPESQPNRAYPWAIPGKMGSSWSPERRCSEISSRLEKYRPDGLIDLTTSKENGENILCVTTEANPNCRLVLTVPHGQNPQETRDAVFQNLTVADSGQQTQGVNTYAGGGSEGEVLNQLEGVLGIGKAKQSNSSSQGIHLKPFLDGKDGGTGDRLKSSVKSRSGALNPNKFR
jgi:Circadian oscillating protein COP23